MKKLLVTLALVTAGVATVTAQSPTDYRYYINPGHGSWTGNDRPIQTIGHKAYSSTNTDTTAFFESNTDLIKGFGMLETLIEMGVPFDRTRNQEGERWQVGAAKDLTQSIVMSRVKNGPYESVNTTDSKNYMLYNRSLSEICAEVDANDFDIFVSIHSNAATVGSITNYHLFMYRGLNGRDNVEVEGSYEMAEAAAIYSYPNTHSSWTVDHAYIQGDYDWMHYYLGVLKHECPGYLVEGYFHTYLPATHRGMNFDVDFEEGCAYGRGVAEYFGFDREKTGDIYGIIRDQHEKFTHDLYKPQTNSPDIYKPLNGVKVKLFKDGQQIKEYTTDENYNGAFVFFDLEPGTYTVTCEHPDYKNGDATEIEVVPGNCVYPRIWLENVDWVTSDDFLFNYPDELGKNTAYGANDSYNFNLELEQTVAELSGKKIRRVVAKGQKLYILALDASNEPTIVVYDTEAKKVVATPSTEGMDGTEMKCADIQVTADGILVACNKEKLHYDNSYIQEGDLRRGILRFYRWENDYQGYPDGAPVNFVSTQNSSLWYRTYAGSTFAYQGTLDDGVITVSNPSISGVHSLRTLEIMVRDGKFATESPHKPVLALTPLTYIDDNLGENYRFIVSPLSDRKVWIVTEKGGIIEIDNDTSADGNVAVEVVSKLPALTDASGANAFKYAGHSYLTLPSGTGSVNMFDVTDGLDKAREVDFICDEAGAAALTNGGGVAATTVVLRNEATNEITSAYIVMMSVDGNNVKRYSTQNVAQPLSLAPYAYALASKGDTDSKEYEITFHASQDAAVAELILTPTDGSAEIVKNLGTADKGLNTATLDATELADGKAYNWAVRLTGYVVPSAGLVYAEEPTLRNNSRGGVNWIDDTDSPNFGLIVTSAAYAQGITVYNPDLTKRGVYKPEGNTWDASKYNSPCRLTSYKGVNYIVDQSDKGAGYWVFDASNPETTYDILAGERDSKGAHIYNGKSIGGSASSIAIQGEGENACAYIFSEDFPTGNGTYTLVRQKIGTSNPWNVAPEEFGGITGKSYMLGLNVEVVAVNDGVFVSQYRVADGNIETNPVFLYVDNAGNIKFNSASLLEKLQSGGSGFAITKDLSMAAISEKAVGIGIWDVEWNDNTPSFTKRYLIPGSAGTDEINQLAFDNAGNLYAWHRGNFGFRAYSLKNEAPVAVTAAPSGVLLDSEAGVSDVLADDFDENTPVEYFDLRGARISNPQPGTLVIRRQGSTVTKVVVK